MLNGRGMPLNPRNRSEGDYRRADAAWIAALNLHLRWRDYWYDRLKPKS